ncbi:hypothetical protein KL918_000698 [Ogataea parapolymorpha]|uniref:Myo-inositol transporter 2 n=1 Tax=Ogataea parapolymorpha (strain ATCC 26012 / BCRC 20466 / JCM 22074 / NRRL Y-7560 / DL-1) TaxID=871575 RepID=W1Q9Q7_OGAPD|nr:Myo-inositol transporter 2 [Ogataea parapolymorpha DL-1]ESW97088.1 Myo-inositol transporter 2 [Ogataea parapolymorpha DL-1]KAG7869153.1 hypothetical protein KL918_000698 [Ogataea parapolymorpha]KAG7875796.1 hypothetical protein KL916_000467 [Ogataea parapolymorpha]
MSDPAKQDELSSTDVDALDYSSKDSQSDMIAMDSAKPTPLVVVLVCLASISGFMFGYDTGYISSALVSIGTDLGKTLTYGEEEFITAATSLGALITSVVAGPMADIFGRKPVLMFSNTLFVVGAIIQCAAETVWTMIAGRFVMGFGVGIGSLIAPLFISELAPSRFRGRLVILNCMGITCGQLIAYAIGAGLTHVNNGWRIQVGLSIVPPAIQLAAFLFLPDTPRYLISKNKLEKAAKVIARTHHGATATLIQMKIAEIQSINSSLEGKNVWQRTWNGIKKIHSVPSNFRALIIACGLQGIQQFTGFNSLMYFSATIFKAIGFDNSTAVSIIVSGTNFLMTIVAFFIIDRVGRRKMLLFSLPIMMIAMIICAVGFHYVDLKFEHHSVKLEGGVSNWGYVIMVFMIVYVAGYAIGIGNVPWQQSELFPQNVRGTGASYATATNWSGSLVISATFLTMLENITPTGTFALFAALTAVSIVFVYFVYPELSNLALEETQNLLKGGFNIKESLVLAEKRKHQKLSPAGSMDKLDLEHIDEVQRVESA